MILQWLLTSSGSMVMPIGFATVTTVISLVCSLVLLGRTARRAEAGRHPRVDEPAVSVA